MALRSRHSAQRIGEAGRYQEDGEYLEKIAERSGILKWVSAIGVEESAAVGSQHLDGFLGGDRALSDNLTGRRLHERLAVLAQDRLPVLANFLYLLRLNDLDRVIRLEVLNYSLVHQNQRKESAERQQNPESSASHVYPEVAERLLLSAGNASNQRHSQSDSHCGRNKIMIGKARHLREITHGVLTAIELPVGIGGKRRSGVKREVGRNIGKMLGVPRQSVLYALDEVQHQHGDGAEEQHGNGVFRPAHLVLFVHARQLVKQLFYRTQDWIEKGAFTGKDLGHEDPQRLGDRKHHGKEQQNLRPAIGCHQNFSGLSSA